MRTSIPLLFASITACLSMTASALQLGPYPDPLNPNRWAVLNPAIAGGYGDNDGDKNPKAEDIAIALGGTGWEGPKGDVAEEDFGGALSLTEGDYDLKVVLDATPIDNGATPPISAQASGTWSFDSSFWSVYDYAAISMHVGGGSSNPDHFIFLLQDQATSGDWAVWSDSGWSNLQLWGLKSETPPPILTRVPDGGTTVALFGFALLGLGGTRRLLRTRN